MTLPSCTSKNSVIDSRLRERHKNGELKSLSVTVVLSQSLFYVTAFFSDEPARPIYLATRRNRKEPKTFVDMTRLTNSLIVDLAGVPIQVVG